MVLRLIMHAFVEYPCACKGVIVVRIGPEATHAPKPYVFSITCKVAPPYAIPIGVAAPEGGIPIEWLLAGRAAVMRECGLKIRFTKVRSDGKIIAGGAR